MSVSERLSDAGYGAGWKLVKLLPESAARKGFDVGADIAAWRGAGQGQLRANLARVLPVGLVGEVDRGSWQVPAVFSLVNELGPVEWSALEQTLNLGVGMVAVLPAADVDAAARHCAAAGIDAWPLGTVRHAGATDDDLVSGTKGVQAGAVSMHGNYRTT